jgi:sulfur-oxidizing protein SoxZ
MASIKVRAKAKDGVVTVKALMNHVMESGRRKDKKTGDVIPAHYIKTVTVSSGDKTILTADWTGSVSKNPYLSCKYKGAAGEKLKISWVDTKDKKAEAEVEVK